MRVHLSPIGSCRSGLKEKGGYTQGFVTLRKASDALAVQVEFCPEATLTDVVTVKGKVSGTVAIMGGPRCPRWMFRGELCAGAGAGRQDSSSPSARRRGEG